MQLAVALVAVPVALAAGLVASVLAELAWPGIAGTVGTAASPAGAPVPPSFSVGGTDLASWRG